MTVIDLRTMRETETPPFSVVCLGNFDGVHNGHRTLASAALQKRDELSDRFPGIACGACFFKISSVDFLFSSKTPHLSTFSQKLSLFASLGLDYAFVTDFESIRNLSPDQYVNDVLKKRLHCVFSICGFNFHFGKKAAGTAEDLVALMDGNAQIIPPVCVGDLPVSSSLIRQKIAEGDVASATDLLGRPYCIDEEVLHGKGLGRTWGLPTINQHFPAELAVPLHGIYVTRTHVDGIAYPSVTNVGIRPTVEQSETVNCETHILDFDRDVYGKTVKVEFLKRLRGEIRFNSPEDLQTQIRADIAQTRIYYKEASSYDT